MISNTFLIAIRKAPYSFFVRNRRAILLTSVLLLLSRGVFAQQKITGVITGVDHMPLFSAAVTVKSTSRAATTGLSGQMGMKITESRVSMIQKMDGENKSVEMRDLADAEGSTGGTKVS